MLIKKAAELNNLDADRLPFLKRYPYRDENEYRVICVDFDNAEEFKDYNIEIGWIKEIILSPWMSPPLETSVRDVLNSITGCSGLKIRRSQLIDTLEWRKITSRTKQA